MVIPLERKQLVDTFLHKNSQLNLSAIRDAEGVYIKHILDSLEVEKFFSFPEGATVCDVGTGSGFPLLPLAMRFPQSHFTGLDSVRKKLIAIEEMMAVLGIMNADTVWTRAEDHHKSYDIVMARAVAYIDSLLNWTYHLVKPGGLFVFFKLYTDEEYQAVLKFIRQKKLTLLKEHRYKLFDGDVERIIYILKK
ncbi:MAG TPA: 16S rRNA (guanine(527)-N(7))-methyltransferase RsmG [Candidatus Absconditabacterales bacterium]|nr:16S rRNA (guanine(527)-N(7))-methyltransferase RsmG [Candidatus Absconditabacterales bacterium]